MLMTPTENALKEYRNTLSALVEIKQSLGLMETAPQKLDVRGMFISGHIDFDDIPNEIKELSDAEFLDLYYEISANAT
jgi:hypothetical protein